MSEGKSKGYSKIYASETEKILPKVQPYIVGKVLDIGCGEHKITPEAVGVDVRMPQGVRFKNIDQVIKWHKPKEFDLVYSSHCLEHIVEDGAELTKWMGLVSDQGTLFIYLPCDDKYDNASNPEHVQRYTLPDFIMKFNKLIGENGFYVVDSGNDYGEDKYSFYVVLKRNQPESAA